MFVFFILVYTGFCIIGIAALVVGEILIDQDVSSPIFLLIGTVFVIKFTVKIAHLIYKAVDNKELLLFLSLLFFAISIWRFFKERKEIVQKIEHEALDSVFYKIF